MNKLKKPFTKVLINLLHKLKSINAKKILSWKFYKICSIVTNDE